MIVHIHQWGMLALYLGQKHWPLVGIGCILPLVSIVGHVLLSKKCQKLMVVTTEKLSHFLNGEKSEFPQVQPGLEGLAVLPISPETGKAENLGANGDIGVTSVDSSAGMHTADAEKAEMKAAEDAESPYAHPIPKYEPAPTVAELVDATGEAPASVL
eukprot:TRINITY_DN8331_c0_g1_i3.p1 TRINITY_DN8331_c0_g1~~TRINITY_DN8331_c0_g1_i3.p1  ORF type:complete len:157 (-),score=25.09 TRINITY_DN8331_c0_g1_i3:39-509(-)